MLAPVSGILEVTFAEEYMRVCLMQCSHVSFELSMRQLRDINALRERISGVRAPPDRKHQASIYLHRQQELESNFGGSRLWRQLWFFAAQCLTCIEKTGIAHAG